MIWRKHLNGVLNVLIINARILSEKATNDLLGFPNVASQAFFDSILALGIRKLKTPSECFFPTINICFIMQFFGAFKKTYMYKTSKELETEKIVFKEIKFCFKLKFGCLKFTLKNE